MNNEQKNCELKVTMSKNGELKYFLKYDPQFEALMVLAIESYFEYVPIDGSENRRLLSLLDIEELRDLMNHFQSLVGINEMGLSASETMEELRTAERQERRFKQ